MAKTTTNRSVWRLFCPACDAENEVGGTDVGAYDCCEVTLDCSACGVTIYTDTIEAWKGHPGGWDARANRCAHALRGLLETEATPTPGPSVEALGDATSTDSTKALDLGRKLEAVVEKHTREIAELKADLRRLKMENLRC